MAFTSNYFNNEINGNNGETPKGTNSGWTQLSSPVEYDGGSIESFGTPVNDLFTPVRINTGNDLVTKYLLTQGSKTRWMDGPYNSELTPGGTQSGTISVDNANGLQSLYKTPESRNYFTSVTKQPNVFVSDSPELGSIGLVPDPDWKGGLPLYDSPFIKESFWSKQRDDGDDGFMSFLGPALLIGSMAMGLPGLFETLGLAGAGEVAAADVAAADLVAADMMAGLLPESTLAEMGAAGVAGADFGGFGSSVADLLGNTTGLDSLFNTSGFSGADYLASSYKPTLGFDLPTVTGDITSNPLAEVVKGGELGGGSSMADYGNYYSNIDKASLTSPEQYFSGNKTFTLKDTINQMKNMWNQPLFEYSGDNILGNLASKLSSPDSLMKLYQGFNSMSSGNKIADAMEQEKEQLMALSGKLDPFGSQRGYYQGILKNLYTNPFSDPFVSSQRNLLGQQMAAKAASMGRSSASGDIAASTAAAMLPYINSQRELAAKLAGASIGPESSASVLSKALGLGPQAEQMRANASGMIPYALASIFKPDTKDAISALVDKLLG